MSRVVLDVPNGASRRACMLILGLVRVSGSGADQLESPPSVLELAVEEKLCQLGCQREDQRRSQRRDNVTCIAVLETPRWKRQHDELASAFSWGEYSLVAWRRFHTGANHRCIPPKIIESYNTRRVCKGVVA